MYKHTPPTYNDLVGELNENRPTALGKILTFEGIGNNDAYNPALIIDNGTKYLAVRVESRESFWRDPTLWDPRIEFFIEKEENVWTRAENTPTINLIEDPFACWVHDDNGEKTLIVGGVTLDRSTDPPTIVTQFFKGKSVQTLATTPFAQIKGMKDIRIVERSDNKTKIVCVRPQGGDAKRGRIGITEISSLSELENVVNHPYCLLENQVHEGTWLGPNELYLLTHNGKEEIGVLGHIAFKDDEGYLHYAAMVFKFDPVIPCDETHEHYHPTVIATREMFEKADPKTPSLWDVVFPASIELWENDMVKLYVGVSDAQTAAIIIPNPFLS